MRFSVLMCTFNCAQYLSRSINSILSQDYDDFELIVVNDASTDDTLQVISQFKDPRLKVITNEINLNTMKSRKIAFDNSKGDFILWCDADDYFTRKDMLTILSRYNYEMVTYGIMATDIAWGFGVSNCLFKTSLTSSRLIRKYCKQCPFVWNRMFRRDLLKRVYENVSVTDAFMNEDTVLVKTAINVCRSYSNANYTFYYYNMNTGYSHDKERLLANGGRWGNLKTDTVRYLD